MHSETDDTPRLLAHDLSARPMEVLNLGMQPEYNRFDAIFTTSNWNERQCDTSGIPDHRTADSKSHANMTIASICCAEVRSA